MTAMSCWPSPTAATPRYCASLQHWPAGAEGSVPAAAGRGAHWLGGRLVGLVLTEKFAPNWPLLVLLVLLLLLLPLLSWMLQQLVWRLAQARWQLPRGAAAWLQLVPGEGAAAAAAAAVPLEEEHAPRL